MTARSSDPVDRYVATRLRAARVSIGLSQTELGEAMGGVSFQQIQKYEKAVNRVSIGRLALAAKATRRPITWFLEGAAQPEAAALVPDIGAQLLAAPGGAELAVYFLAIRDPEHRGAILRVAEILGSMPHDAADESDAGAAGRARPGLRGRAAA
jgi:transcriptional regulator with XRE-family HTH domain